MMSWNTFFLSLVCLIPQVAMGKLSYDLHLDLREGGRKGNISGAFVAGDGFEGGEICFYLPLNDSKYHIDPARGMSPTALRYGRQQKLPGIIEIKESPGGTLLKPHLFKFNRMNKGDKFYFRTAMPRWNDREDKRWFYNDFYPIPLLECPGLNTPGLDYQKDLKSKIVLTVRKTPSWILLHSGEEIAANESIHFTGSKFAFMYGHKDAFKVRRLKVGKTEVTAGYYTESFPSLVQFIEPLLSDAQRLLGSFPYRKLLVVETEDLEKSLIPGVITINREKHRSKNSPESPFHWNIWQLANFLPQQWFGVSLYPSSIREYWFHRGMEDTVAYLLLKNNVMVYDFFKSGKSFLDFTFDYRQAQDVVAGALTFLHPFNALTDQNGKTLDAHSDQHSLGYIRHSLALRYLYWNLGQERFAQMLRQFLRIRRFTPTNSRDFLNFLRNGDGEDVPSSDTILLQWWTQDGWPDFDVRNIAENKISGNEYKIDVVVHQGEDYRIPVDVVVTDQKGHRHSQRTNGLKKEEVVSFVIPSPMVSVEINPDRNVYDGNRFDNSNKKERYNFFPGAARTIKDDETTVFWMPLFAQRPGEGFSIILSAVMLRYLQGIYSTMFSYVPSENRLGFQGFFLTDLPKYGLFTIMRVAQDFGNALRGERNVELGLYRAPFLLKDPVIEVGGRIRSKQQLGLKDTIHQTLTSRLRVVPLNAGRCHYRFMLDLERTPGTSKGGFRYRRDLSLFQSNCRVFSVDLGLRAFWGELDGDGPIPSNAFFKPQNEDEARIRIDSTGFESALHVTSLGFDVLWPATLPVPPEWFLLPRESRWRLFYDVGTTKSPSHLIRGAGGGVLIPMGGNAVGKRSISILQLSILAVLFRSMDGEVDHKPGILIDFFGKL